MRPTFRLISVKTATDFVYASTPGTAARMALSCLSANPSTELQKAKYKGQKGKGLEGLDHLTLVSTVKHETIDLVSPAGATWTVGDLEDTIYSRRKNVVNGWNKFYLPDIVDMKVMGVVEGTSCPCDQLVLMTCEDENIYAYDGDELHLVASSLMQLRVKGIKYPAAKSYYKGEAFKEMTDEDWDEVRKGDVGKRLDEEHHKLVTANDSQFLKNLRSIRPKAGACS